MTDLPEPAPHPDMACEMSTRVVTSYFRYFEKVCGHERLVRAIERIGGTPTLDYLFNTQNFVSLDYCVRVAEVLAAESGDAQFMRKAGLHQFTEPSMLGFAYYALRSLGSPRLYYRFAVKLAPQYNRVSDASILHLSNTHLRMRYRSLRPEGGRLLCEGRMGQIAGAPTLWGLPPATVREVECQAQGAPACIYELHWLPMFRPALRGLGGALAGAAIGFGAGGLAAAAWSSGLGALLVLVLAYRAQSKAKTSYLLDSAEGYRRSLEELRLQFEEVRRLNTEMDAAQKALLAEMQRRQRAEADLIEAKKLEALGRLAGGIAHDFNNILTVIRIDAQFARELLQNSGDVVKSLDGITEAADRAAHLTRQLLTFARKQKVEARPIALEDHVHQMKDMLAKMAGERVTLEFLLADEPSVVLIDPGQLEQVLVNLTVNARDAMPRGGRLRFATRRVSLPEKDASMAADLPPGEYVLLTVTDTGTGMSPETLERIFEPFFTTKEGGQGTGLGLATCHGIVHQAQGDLRVESTLGDGSSFFVFLPRVGLRPERVAGPAESARLFQRLPHRPEVRRA